MNRPPMIFAFLLGIRFAAQRLEEARLGIDADDLHAKVVGEDLIT